MESTDHQVLQDSKSSSEEDQVNHHHRHGPDHLNDDMGTGRSYECVFCKRGFTTAQALGGHMNIHRKERGNIKPRPSSAPTSNSTSSLSTHVAGSHHGVQSYPPHDVDHVKYRKNSPAPNTTRVVRPSPPIHANVHVSDHEELIIARKDCIPRQQNLLTDDNRNWRSGSSLSLGIGSSSRDCVNDGGDGLDLELRLGHDPT